MKRNAMLAVDMGASNGRVVWGQWHESGLECREIHRFDNVPIQRNGLMCWDMPRLMDEIAQGIAKCDRAFDTLGLCSWGNTIGLLDEEKNLIEVAPGEYSVEGAMKLDDLNDRLGLELESEDYDSVGGLIIGLLDHLPEEGEEVADDGIRFVVTKVDKNRIDRVKIILPKEEKEEEPA